MLARARTAIAACAQFLRTLCHALLTVALVGYPIAPAHADLRVPAWYDVNTVITAPDWHYRVPITIPAGTAINATIKTDVNFTALLTQLGVSGTFDVNSWRIVRPTGALATTAEYTDSVFAGATDVLNNERGEIRFLLQDAGPVTYYLYFDITQNGSKPANTQTRINGNFEADAANTLTPTGWSAPTKSNAAYQAFVAGSGSVSVAANSGTPATVTATSNPFTGNTSYLIGARDVIEPTTSNPAITLLRTFVVPAGATAGNLKISYRIHGWDSAANGTGTNYDFIQIQILGIATTTIVGPTLNNYASFPFSGNLGVNAQSATVSGYGPYNGWDSTTSGTRTAGMSIPIGGEPWFNVNASLAAYAGQTVTLRITSRHSSTHKSWFHIDDVEWSVTNGILGNPEGFGVNITTPGTNLNAGSNITIIARVDAQGVGVGNPVTANVYNNLGVLVASGIRLYDNGTRGDAVANDGNYSNNGSVFADPTFYLQANTPATSGWTVRVFARDGSTNIIGAQNGLIKIVGQPTPEIQTNYFNIDDQTFNVVAIAAANFTVVKSAQIISDPINGGSTPKSIPGAVVLYTMRVTNTGNGSSDASSFVFSDLIPNNTELFVDDLSGPGTGPIIFTNGSPTSNLTYSFISLGSVADTLEFSSNNGASWNHTPSPIINGYAASVTNFRFRPTGTFAINAGTPPFFDLRFQVRIK